MAVPPSSPKSNAPFFVISLASHNSNPIVPEAFVATHLEEGTNLKLTSDACDRTWQVKLNGRRFADGWEDFSTAHCLRHDDFLIFRDDGQMTFHVTPSGRRFSRIHYISSSSDDDSEADETDDDDDDSEDDNEDDSEDDEGEDHDDETWDKVSDLRRRIKTESSSCDNSCIIGVTSSNLRLNRVNLAKSFMITNGLHKSWCEIDLMNQSGESWVVRLRHNKSCGQDFMHGGWRSFCHENKLKTGCFYRFELVRTGTRPALQLCSDNIPQRNCSMNRGKFMTVTVKPYMLKSRQLHLRNSFARENGIKKGGKINLVDKNGGTWPSCVASGYVNGGFYLAKGWIGCCKASGVTTGETFTLKFVREKGKTPIIQFCSKAKTRFQKKARVSAGESSRRTHASQKSTVDTNNLQCKQPLGTISHQVRQSIVNVLADVRRFRSELEIKEQNLEAVLEDIDVLGEKVSEINNFFM